MAVPCSLRESFRAAVSPAAAWRELSNTDRFNRVLGLARMRPEPGGGPDFSLRVRSRSFGVPLAWRELPFEWLRERYFRARREFEGSPFERFEGGVDIEPDGDGCRVTLVSDFRSRGPLGGWLVRALIFPKTVRVMRALLRELEAAERGGREAAPAPPRGRTEAREAALARAAAALRGTPADPAIRERVIRLLRDGYDDEVRRVRPFEAADRWGADRIRTLATFLYAVKAGLFELEWAVLCPNCTAPKQVAGSLARLDRTSHCDSCRIEYDADLGENVELRFTAHPGVRPLDLAVYCAASPVHARVAVAQLDAPPGGRRALELELPPGSYVLRGLRSKRAVALLPDGAETCLRLGTEGGGPPARLSFRPGRVRLELAAGPEGELFRLEADAWRDQGAKASVVTALQEFRNLFAAEVLSPGVEVAVRRVALLFSDLRGSTALYESVGDAAAYAIVREHFDYLFEIVRAQRGAVVKTIGDAVMAVFSSGADALEAAFRIQEGVERLNARLAPRPPVIIKLGLHQGPSIAINSEGVLDYFGTTVNISARVQNESVGGDIMITEELSRDPEAASVLALHPCRREAVELRLKGLSEAFRLVRLLPGARPC